MEARLQLEVLGAVVVADAVLVVHVLVRAQCSPEHLRHHESVETDLAIAARIRMVRLVDVDVATAIRGTLSALTALRRAEIQTRLPPIVVESAVAASEVLLPAMRDAARRRMFPGDELLRRITMRAPSGIVLLAHAARRARAAAGPLAIEHGAVCKRFGRTPSRAARKDRHVAPATPLSMVSAAKTSRTVRTRAPRHQAVRGRVRFGQVLAQGVR